jgi:hypothetical protein
MIPIGVNAVNLIMGPTSGFFVAPFGTTEPTDAVVSPQGYTTPPASPWADIGATDGGVTFEADLTYTDFSVDQLTMSPGARLTETKITVATKMSEMTLANLNTAMNGIGITGSGSGYNTFDIPVGATSTQPSYVALCIYGWAPTLSTGLPALRRIIVRKVLSQVKATLAYDKKTQESLDVTFTAYFVSGSINPVHITDEDS